MLLAAALVLCAGCQTAPPAAHRQRCEFQSPHMGTLFTITLYAPNTNAAAQTARAAFKRIAALERTMTDYDPDSELMRLCRSPVGQPVQVSPDLFDVLAQAQRLARLSNGAFDVTVGPYVRLWRRTRRTGVRPPSEALQKAAQSVGWEKLRLDPATSTVTLLATNMQLDLGGIAKGYAGDQALRTLRAAGIGAALVAASGDLAIGDAPPGTRGWRVGIGLPDRADNKLARQLLLANAAVSTSGDTEQFVELDGVRYSHILDPRTGVGLTNRVQASVIARHATATDALATTVCVLGPELGLKLVDRLGDTSALVLLNQGDELQVRPSRRLAKIAGAGQGK